MASKAPPSADPRRDPVLRAALEAVTAGLRACRRVRARHVSAISKDDRSPVTVADYASQALILRHLAAHHQAAGLGGLVVVAEEEADFLSAHDAQLAAVVEAVRPDWSDASADTVLAALSGGRRPGAGEAFWTLDPVDGTKGFLRNEQYAIALAYIAGGTPQLAVLGCPNLAHDPAGDPGATPAGMVAFARAGDGAFELHDGADAQPLRLPLGRHDSGTARVRVCLSVESGHSDTGRIDGILAALEAPIDAVKMDSQCKYAAVARGQADVYVRAGRGAGYSEWIWDHAAGALIASEAGCVVSDLDGRPLDFSLGPRLTANTGIVCALARLHPLVLAAARARPA
jgi:3'(2'), 5'-bisphosphate nucleotidase